MIPVYSRRRSLLLGGLVAVTLGLFSISMAACGGEAAQTGTQATTSTLAGSSPSQSAFLNTITMSGTGTVNTLPDEAVIQVGVENSAATAAAALDANSKQTQKVLDRLKADGVPDAAIETTNVAVYPNVSYDPKTGQGRTTGYQATNMVNVTLTDFKLIGQVFAAATEAGANNVSGPTWQLSEDSKAMVEALTKAAANSRAKAEGVAAAEGVKIGQVLIVSETTTQSVIPPTAAESSAAGGTTPSVTPPPVSPQNLQITASLSVTYRLTQ